MRRHDFDLPDPPANDRPGDDWVCGHADQGAACAHGPSASGQCPGVGACRPIATSGGWRCARPACLGGACDAGPSAAGVCALRPDRCAPRPSWRLQRRRITVASFAGAAAVLAMMIAVPWRHEPLRPGPLAAPHAQILGGHLASDRCAACHPAARGSLAAWFTSAGAAHAGITQTQLCMDCHHATIDRGRATLAHQLTATERAALRSGQSDDGNQNTASWRDWMPAAAVDMEHVDCAACHREHHGSTADLAALTNQQCQTCHQDRFGSLADGHPDWGSWPYGRSGRVAFDHASHYGKHFSSATATAASTAAGATKWDCRSCHAATETGQFARSGSYETTCAACHDAPLRIEAAEGLDLLALPSLPAVEAAQLDAWPAAAQGFYSGRIGPLTRLLIGGDPETAQALAALPAAADWDRIDAADPAARQAALAAAAALERLMDEIAAGGGAAIARRAAQRGLSEATARQLTAALSPQLVADARGTWFAGLTPAPHAANYPPRLRAVLRLVADFREAPINPLRRDAAPTLRPPLSLPAEPLPAVAEQRYAQADNDLLLPDNDLLLPSDEAPQLDDPRERSDASDEALLLAPSADEGLLGDPLATDPLLADPLTADPLLADPLAVDPLLTQPQGDGEEAMAAEAPRGRATFDPELLSPVGGWYRDDLRLAIAYRGGGHADPVLQAAIELAGQLPADDPLADELLSHRSLAACIECHPSAASGGGRSWVSGASADTMRGFTRFTHRPHNHLPLLTDCAHCHRVAPVTADADSAAAGAVAAADFLPLQRVTCAECHTKSGAGDSCTQCHRYHVRVGR